MFYVCIMAIHNKSQRMRYQVFIYSLCIYVLTKEQFLYVLSAQYI